MRRHELTDFVQKFIKPLLPNKPRCVPRVNDRRVLNGILLRFRTGYPGATFPSGMGPLRSATIGSCAGGRPAGGTGSWTRCQPLTTAISS